MIIIVDFVGELDSCDYSVLCRLMPFDLLNLPVYSYKLSALNFVTSCKLADRQHITRRNDVDAFVGFPSVRTGDKASSRSEERRR